MINKLAEQFTANISTIEGPIYAYVLTPRFNKNYPSLLILGDIHGGYFKCEDCQYPKCISLYNESFFQHIVNFSKSNNVIVDIFFETWTDHLRYKSNTSALADCIQNSIIWKQKYSQYIKFHFCDVRVNVENYGWKRNVDTLPMTFINNVIAYLNEDPVHNKNILQRFGDENKYKQLKRMISAESFNKFKEIDFLQANSRTIHEFNQLTDDVLKTQLNSYINTRWKKKFNRTRLIMPTYHALIDSHLKNNIDIKFSDFSELKGNDGPLIHMFSLLVETYTLSRIFRPKSEVKFGILFFGAEHTRNVIGTLCDTNIYFVNKIYFQDQPKCLIQSKKTTYFQNQDISRLSFDYFDKNILTDPDQFLNQKNDSNQSLLELYFIFKPAFTIEIIKTLLYHKYNLKIFRSSIGSSIFAIAVENNTNYVLELLIKKYGLPKERGLIKTALLHQSNDCLLVLIEKKYSPNENIQIGNIFVNSFLFSLIQNNIIAFHLLLSTVTDNFFKTLLQFDILEQSNIAYEIKIASINILLSSGADYKYKKVYFDNEISLQDVAQLNNMQEIVDIIQIKIDIEILYENIMAFNFEEPPVAINFEEPPAINFEEPQVAINFEEPPVGIQKRVHPESYNPEKSVESYTESYNPEKSVESYQEAKRKKLGQNAI